MDDLKFYVFNVTIDWLLASQSNIFIVTTLRSVCNSFKMIVDTNALYKRRKAAELLKITLNVSGYNTMVCGNLIKYPPPETCMFDDFRIFANTFYNIGTNFKFNDYSFSLYKRNLHDYKMDKLNPLKGLRAFKYFEIRRHIKCSVNLSLALNHADKPLVKSFSQYVF
jgi:hypothetical protein